MQIRSGIVEGQIKEAACDSNVQPPDEIKDSTMGGGS